jgi:hypothetical protein
MLHIHDGESSAQTSRESTIPGRHFGWREALISGPAPSDVSPAQWRQIRAKHLSDYYGVDRLKAAEDLLRQEEVLASFAEYEEVVLWFEHDLFCQTNLLYLLDWFAGRDLGKTRLSMICIGAFPGIEKFRGLGQLNADQMASLFTTRHEVSAAELNLATRAWQAYRSVDPTEIEKLLETDTSAMPFLERALQLHLARFPFVRNGLGRIENLGLQLIRSGSNTFTKLFAAFGDEEPVYGLGDCQFWLALNQMTHARKPLLTVKNGIGSAHELSSEEIRNGCFEITETGVAVLQSEADFVALNGIDLWLGGVHLSEENLWRWDDETRRIVQA